MMLMPFELNSSLPNSQPQYECQSSESQCQFPYQCQLDQSSCIDFTNLKSSTPASSATSCSSLPLRRTRQPRLLHHPYELERSRSHKSPSPTPNSPASAYLSGHRLSNDSLLSCPLSLSSSSASSSTSCSIASSPSAASSPANSIQQNMEWLNHQQQDNQQQNQPTASVATEVSSSSPPMMTLFDSAPLPSFRIPLSDHSSSSSSDSIVSQQLQLDIPPIVYGRPFTLNLNLNLLPESSTLTQNGENKRQLALKLVMAAEVESHIQPITAPDSSSSFQLDASNPSSWSQFATSCKSRALQLMQIQQQLQSAAIQQQVLLQQQALLEKQQVILQAEQKKALAELATFKAKAKAQAQAQVLAAAASASSSSSQSSSSQSQSDLLPPALFDFSNEKAVERSLFGCTSSTSSSSPVSFSSSLQCDRTVLSLMSRV